MKIAAACHVHSDWSYDGSWKIEDLASEFSGRGYGVLMLTEHDRGFTPVRAEEHREACRRASSKEILVIPGIEYSEATNTVHVLVWGSVPFLGEDVPTNDLLTRVQQAGGVAVLAHPSRRKAWERFDPAWSDRLLGIEIWNRKTDGWRPSPNAPELIASSGAMPFASLDFHTSQQMFPLSMSLECEGSLTEESVLQCLKARRCQPYAFGMALRPNIVRTGLTALGPLEFARKSCERLQRRLALARAQKLRREAGV